MSAATLGRQSFVIFSSGWLNTAIGILATILVAHRLGPQALGALGFGFGMVGLFMAAILPGFSQAHLKRLSEGQDVGRCVATMTAIQVLPKMDATKDWWFSTFGTDIFWPWYALIGLIITLAVAWATNKIFPSRSPQPQS